MMVLADDVRAVLWCAVIPAALAVAVLIVGVREPSGVLAPATRRWPTRASDLRHLSAGYWLVVVVGAVLTLARFSEAFLILRAENVGLGIGLVPMVMVVMSAVYAASAYPAGALADRIDRQHLLALGLGVLILANLILALATTVGQAMAGAALWGLHMGLTQGLLATLIADSCPARLRGTAFGLFNLIGGLALLAANALAGWLWVLYGAPAPFAAGAVFATIGLVGLLLAAPGQRVKGVGRG